MNFVVTARKWRPQIFEDVVGQEHITKTLKNAIVNNRIAHSFIFAGPRGVGKTTTARILAKSLNCLNPKDGEPCNECDMCKSFQTSQSLDIIEIDGASNRRIDEIRTLRESVKYAPSKGKYKIYIIDEVHMLTNESFNALLKTLEEPPEHTIFVFATTDIHKVPLTIISRCQRFDFRRIELNAIKNQLAKIAASEKIKIDDQSLTLIAKKADGALRDAQSLFDQVISFCGTNVKAKDISQMLNLIDEELYFIISDAIIDKNFESAFSVSQKIYDHGWNYIDFINGLVEHFRNILTVVITKDHKLLESAEVFKTKYLEYGNRFTEGDLLRILSMLNKTVYEVKNTQNQKLKVEIALSHLIGLERTSTISEIIKLLQEQGGKINNSDNPVPITSQQSTKSSASPKKNYSDQNNTENKLTSNKVESPQVEKFSAPAVNTTTNLGSVVEKWNEFVDFVQKDFTFGPLLCNSQPELNGNSLKINIEKEEDIEQLKGTKEKLNARIKEFFGTPCKMEFSTKNKIPSHQIKSDDNNSNLIHAIVDQLGGREVN
ncbi:MAG: DNA polymerase III subunit gamma/tau [Melioribacteraceae bacterium]|nr:DNA polymerase III subunit gamma/tau [Melioribacteraceae bacterium]